MAPAILKRLIRRVAYTIAPEWSSQVDMGRMLAEQARELQERLRRLSSLEDRVDAMLESPHLRPSQKRNEILQLLQLLQEASPKYLCEIGTQGGGTLGLFCQVADVHAQILSVDIVYPLMRRVAYRALAKPGQRIGRLQGDSHSPETHRKIVAWLRGHKLDFLFIDGDHTLEGVRRDFEMYTPLVRKGGLVALHDIMPDFQTRYGQVTSSYTGGVPVFWRELKQRYANCREFVDDPSQDGFGIGVVRKETEDGR